MDIDAIAEELYGLPPDEFTAARDEAARTAKDRDLRKSLKALRKPTAGAHAVNALVRERPADLDALLALGEELRGAMGRDATTVRRLTEDRRASISALVDPDLPVSVQQDIAATLEAATADPDLGAAVRAGRLVKPLRYAGFGAMPDLDDVVATPIPRAPVTTSPKPAAKQRKTASVTRATRAPSEPQQTRTQTKAKTATADTSSDRADSDLAEARQRCLELSGVADDAQRRYEVAVRNAAEARKVLDALETERAEAKKAARAAHAEAERARREVGRLERA